MDREAWQAAVHGAAKSWTRLSDFHFHFHTHTINILNNHLKKLKNEKKTKFKEIRRKEIIKVKC